METWMQVPLFISSQIHCTYSNRFSQIIQIEHVHIYLTQSFSVLKANMAACVDSTLFHPKLDELTQSKKRKSSCSTTIFIENDFFDKSKRWLQTAPVCEEKQHINLDKLTKQKIGHFTVVCLVTWP